MKVVARLLRDKLPRGVKLPFVLRVYSKAYRSRVDKEWKGYAVLVCDSQRDGDQLISFLNGTDFGKGFIVEAKYGEFSSIERNPHDSDATAWDNLDPPLRQQIRPLDASVLLARSGCAPETPPGEAFNKLVTQLESAPRPRIELRGVPADETLLKQALEALQVLEWPGVSYRGAVNSENYLVLKISPRDREVNASCRAAETSTSSSSSSSSLSPSPGVASAVAPLPPREDESAKGQEDGVASAAKVQETPQSQNLPFQALQNAALRLLHSVEPEYPVSAIAVTKNFIGSPHIDTNDTRYQYAVSLGDFQGGELCVESKDGKSIFVVNTRNRMARVDGRCIHWVRKHTGGDRYSLIFYCSTEEHRQPIQYGADQTYVEKPLAGQ